MINTQLKHPRIKLACDLIAIACIIGVLAILAFGFYANFQSTGEFKLGITIDSTPQILTLSALIIICIACDILSYFLKKQKKFMV